MGFSNIGTLFITFAVLFNSIENSSQSGNNQRAPSYVLQEGNIWLTGPSLGGEAVVVNGYFLGSRENGRFFPVDPNNQQRILNTRTGQFTIVSESFRADLLILHSTRSGRLNLSGRGGHRGGGSASGSNHP